MPTEPRVTPDEVIAAYKATGLVPIREEFACKAEGRLCGCPLTALWASRQPDGWQRKYSGSISRLACKWADEFYGSGYVNAFTGAFDHGVGNLEKTCEWAEQRAIDGFNDGRAAARAMATGFAEVLSG